MAKKAAMSVKTEEIGKVLIIPKTGTIDNFIKDAKEIGLSGEAGEAYLKQRIIDAGGIIANTFCAAVCILIRLLSVNSPSYES